MTSVNWGFSVVLFLGILFLLLKIDKIERVLKDIKKEKEPPLMPENS